MSHPQLSVSLPEAETETKDQRTSNTPSPATGQLRPESQELTDGTVVCIIITCMCIYSFEKRDK